MKHRMLHILRFLRRKSVKRGVRSVVCLLLALMMTASDTLRLIPPVEVTAAETKAAEVSFTNHTLYRWHQIRLGRNLAPTQKWTPVIIGYQYNGKDYYLNTTGIGSTNGASKVFDGGWAKASSWTSQMSKYGFSGINSNTAFYTLDRLASDIGVYRTGGVDEEYGWVPTFLIGRNINWKGDRTQEATAGQHLVYKSSTNANFATPGSEFYKDAAYWYPNTYKHWTIVDQDEHGRAAERFAFSDPNNYDPGLDPALGLEWAQNRIISMVNNGHDALLTFSKDYFESTNSNKYDYGGEFYLWTPDEINLPTIEAENKDSAGNSLLSGCLGSSDINDAMPKVVADVTVHSGTLFNVDKDILIASGAVLVVEPGGTLTIDATVYNNGIIINYGTIFVTGKGCIRPLDPRDKNGDWDGMAGKIICSGSTDNGKTRTGEGNLIMFKGSAAIFNESPYLLTVKDGASVELNGTIFCPQYFMLADSDFHIRESGRLICQYKTNKAAYNNGTKEFFSGAEPSKNGSMTKVVDNKESQYNIPFVQTGKSLFVNDGTFISWAAPSPVDPFVHQTLLDMTK